MKIILVLAFAFPGALCAQSPATAAITWVSIPGGAFFMGAADGRPNEGPVHEVKISTFQMSKSEVTVAQYRACVAAKGCSEPSAGPDCNWGREGREDHPVNCTDWRQAKDFAKWAGGRLPSEAEWEYAARSAGGKRVYPWGDEKPTCELAIMYDQSISCGRIDTWPVCSRPAGNSAQGLCDMAGSLWEWVEDYYHPSYVGAPAHGDARLTPPSYFRIGRGGSYLSRLNYVRAALRRRLDPGNRDHVVGFRVAR